MWAYSDNGAMLTFRLDGEIIFQIVYSNPFGAGRKAKALKVAKALKATKER